MMEMPYVTFGSAAEVGDFVCGNEGLYRTWLQSGELTYSAAVSEVPGMDGWYAFVQCTYSDAIKIRSILDHRLQKLGLCPQALGTHGTLSNGTITSGSVTGSVANNDWIAANARIGFFKCTIARVTVDNAGAPPGGCSGSGNPIYPLLGTKHEDVDLGISIGGLSATLSYDSRPGLPHGVPSTPFGAGLQALGPVWTNSLERGLSGDGARTAKRGNGYVVTFVANGFTSTAPGTGTYTANARTNDRLLGKPTGYHYYDAGARSIEVYDLQGRLTGISWVDGRSIQLFYSDAATPPAIAPAPGYLVEAREPNGRSIRFAYQLPAGAPAATGGRLSAVTDPAGATVGLAYNAAGNLSRLTWQDGKQRQYLYERSDYPSALTGVIDELGVRFATFAYDSGGRAISTEHAGGADRYSVTYGSPPLIGLSETYDPVAQVLYRSYNWTAPTGATLQTPQGGSSVLTAATSFGTSQIASRSQPAGSGCAASTSSMTYDANGNVASRNDFNGTRTCHFYDAATNRERSRIEGLAGNAVCSTYDVATPSLPAGSRRIVSAWHPDWRLESRKAEPRKLTTSVYNGQPDPLNGNAIASCAPAAALLPDGKPIVVLCKRVEQSTTDVNGSQGLAPTLQAGVPNRQFSWTYDAEGRVLTAKGPRTDVNDTTTYAYYPSTAVDYRQGDLAQSVDASGKTTQYVRYDGHGQLLRSIDPNGIVTDITYDPRKALTTATVGGRQTTYTYDAAGQLIEVTHPDTTRTTLGYDAAHRLIRVTDPAGNTTTYTLDTAGSAVQEQVKNASGAISRSVTRVFDALGRLQTVTGAPQ